MLSKILGVMGNFWAGGVPLTYLIPAKRDCNGQLSMRGLRRLNSLCKMPIILR